MIFIPSLAQELFSSIINDIILYIGVKKARRKKKAKDPARVFRN